MLGVPAPAVAGVRENRSTVAAGQGRGSAGAGRGGPGVHNRGGGGGFHGHRGHANQWNDYPGGPGAGRSNWIAEGGSGGGYNQWHRPFQPPQGNFVEGVRGNFRQRGGGGIRNHGRNNSGPIWKEVTQEDGGEDGIPPTQQIMTEDREVARANKAARKKEKLTCYRCGIPGHFVVDCITDLCDICQKPGHIDAACPLLLAPKPVMSIYGVCHSKLMFFETPGSTSVLTPPRLESSRTGLVKVANGDLTAEQVSQQMRRLVSETYNWEPIKVEQNAYQVEFPRREDLQRLLTFGVSKVSGNKCLLEFEECIKPAPQGTRLQKIPDFAPWSYDGVHYDLEIEVEKIAQNEPNDADTLMADGEDRDKDHEDANDQHSDQFRDNTNPQASSNKEKQPIGGASSTSKQVWSNEANEQPPFVSIQRSVSSSRLEEAKHLTTKEIRKTSSAVQPPRRAEPMHTSRLQEDTNLITKEIRKTSLVVQPPRKDEPVHMTQQDCCPISKTLPTERDVTSIMWDSKKEASRPSTPVSPHSFANSKQQKISSNKILHKAKNNALQRFQDVLAYFENCNDSLNHEQAKSEQLEHELEKSHQACRDLRSSKGEIEVAHDKLKRDFEVLLLECNNVKGELIKTSKIYEELQSTHEKSLFATYSSHIVDDTCTSNSTSFEVSTLKENVELRAQLDLLTSNYGKLEENHVMLTSSHADLLTSHNVQKLAHEAIITKVTSSEPHVDNGTTSSQKEIKELKAQVTSLKKDLEQCHEGMPTLNNVLCEQTSPNDKNEFGLNSNKNKRGLEQVNNSTKSFASSAKLKGTMLDLAL
ncbi:hypothetical protein D1007_15896 [Hordeum vulgare]|nr:hypothetical protein D1007_15896 [Hordeum vulgare]